MVGIESYYNKVNICSILLSEVQSEGHAVSCDKTKTVDFTTQHQVATNSQCQHICHSGTQPSNIKKWLGPNLNCCPLKYGSGPNKYYHMITNVHSNSSTFTEASKAYRPQRGIGHVTWFLAKFKPRHNHYGVQTDDVSIITYILLSGLNFAVYRGQY